MPRRQVEKLQATLSSDPHMPSMASRHINIHSSSLCVIKYFLKKKSQCFSNTKDQYDHTEMCSCSTTEAEHTFHVTKLAKEAAEPWGCLEASMIFSCLRLGRGRTEPKSTCLTPEPSDSPFWQQILQRMPSP